MFQLDARVSTCIHVQCSLNTVVNCVIIRPVGSFSYTVLQVGRVQSQIF